MYSQRGAAIAAAAVLFVALSGCSRDTGNSGGGNQQPDNPAPKSAQAVFTPLSAFVPSAPQPVKATDGKFHLAYEVQVLNILSQPIALQSVRAMSGSTTLQNLSGEGLTSVIRVLGAQQPSGITDGGPAFSKPPAAVVGPGQSALVWMDVAVNSEAAVPRDITHAIDLEVLNPSEPLYGKTLTENVAATHVRMTDPVVITSPLRGIHWVDGNGCCATATPHRMASSPLNGNLYAPERFAIDFVQLNDQGLLFTGDKAKMESYAYHGADIHAVADGPIVAVMNDRPEQVPGTAPTGLKIDEYGGNYVVQYLGNGRYAFYAHLMPGDGVKVKVGEQMAKGDVIGKVGNSGNSDAPHLHFHVMDGPDPLASNGLPFVIDDFTLEAQLTPQSLDTVVTGQPAQYDPAVKKATRTDEMPLYRDVLGF
ncbi:MAG: M23 family metallopeptidase [Nocardiaceae bacterium]|nr:M23 family metallopeptidase [Nocardiaceae bacterium]